MSKFSKIIVCLIFLSITQFPHSQTNCPVTEDYFLGKWEGETLSGKKISAEFKKDGSAIFYYWYSGKATPWNMSYKPRHEDNKMIFSGQLSSGSKWEGEFLPKDKNQISGESIYSQYASSPSSPFIINLRRINPRE